ncbi:hypothetical protein [Granulicella arctica]|uniref:hypothetical protein n=1 Tax=Granulicella arctica TaxID=940613 RepID=UPI0021DFBAB1|nr:hypothetical protein [Granulicella arctica]
MDHHRALCPSRLVCLSLVLCGFRAFGQQSLPEAPAPALVQHPSSQSAVIINGRPYKHPTHKEQLRDYLRDSYGLPAFGRSTVRAVFAQGTQKPAQWGQDWPGFGQRFGSSVAITAINGNVRYGMETVLREDMRYIACHGCSARRKVENALLAEVTARHDSDGRRFFTVTPVISDFAGPLIASGSWYPRRDPVEGLVASRTVFATRIGAHLFTEFILERRHKDPEIAD